MCHSQLEQVKALAPPVPRGQTATPETHLQIRAYLLGLTWLISAGLKGAFLAHGVTVFITKTKIS